MLELITLVHQFTVGKTLDCKPNRWRFDPVWYQKDCLGVILPISSCSNSSPNAVGIKIMKLLPNVFASKIRLTWKSDLYRVTTRLGSIRSNGGVLTSNQGWNGSISLCVLSSIVWFWLLIVTPLFVYDMNCVCLNQTTNTLLRIMHLGFTALV